MDVREALVAATMQVFAEAGMRGATTRRIAQVAGVNEVTLFRHFKTKEDLLQAALEAFASKSLTLALPDRPVDPRSELLEWCRAHYRELHKHRAFIRKAMGEFEEHPAQCTCGMQAAIRIAQELTDYLTRLRQAGFTSGSWDERTATNMLMGAIFSGAMGRDTMPERYPHSMRDAVERYVDLLLTAIGVKAVPVPQERRSDRVRGRTA
jgi:AcrR family transcriptional regulator